MKHQRHFDTLEVAQRDAVQICKMIANLDRSVKLLDCDIAAEEERARIAHFGDGERGFHSMVSARFV